MMKNIAVKIGVYGFGVIISLYLFLPFIGYYAADWNFPTAIEKYDKKPEIYQQELKKWKEAQKSAESKDDASSESQQILDEPKSFLIDLAWEHDKYGFMRSAACLTEKYLMLPWAPNTIVILITYPCLSFMWFVLFKKSGLWYHGSNYSFLIAMALIKAAVIFSLIIIGIEKSFSLPEIIVDADIIEAIKVRHASMSKHLIIGFPLIMAIASFFEATFLNTCRGFKPSVWIKFLNNAVIALQTLFLSPFSGAKIKINQAGQVIVKNTELKRFAFLLYLQKKTVKLTLHDFMLKMKNIFLSNVSTGYFKAYEIEIIRQFRGRFIDLNREMQKTFQGEALPKDIRFLLERGNKKIAVIEQEPQIREITFAPMLLQKEKAILKTDERYDYFDDDVLGQTAFRLPFPYVIFFIAVNRGQFEHLHAFWSPQKIYSLSSMLYQFGLPNIGSHGKVCLGYEDWRHYGLGQTCDTVIQHFWQGHFSYHMVETFNETKDDNRGLRTIYDWQKLGTNTDFSMNNISMRKSGRLEGYVEYYLKDEPDKIARIFDDFADDVLFKKPFSLEKLKSSLNFQVTLDQIVSEVRGGK